MSINIIQDQPKSTKINQDHPRSSKINQNFPGSTQKPRLSKIYVYLIIKHSKNSKGHSLPTMASNLKQDKLKYTKDNKDCPDWFRLP